MSLIRVAALLTTAFVAGGAGTAAASDTAPSARNSPLSYGRNASATDGARLTDRAAGLSWEKLKPDTAPSDADTEAMVYDSAMGAVILYTASADTTATWSWDGSTWTDLHVKSPPKRYYSAAAYDEERGEMVLFGGFDGVTSFNDTWVFRDGGWYEIEAATSPSRRMGAFMAYDPSRRQIIMFGGVSGPYVDDTWAFDGTSWTQLDPADHPTERGFGGMTYDPARSALVLYGGSSDRRVTCGKDSGYDRCATWSWHDGTWTKLDLKHSPPGLRYMARATIDGTPMMFGGASNTEFQTDDTWVLHSKSWSLSKTQPRPSVDANLNLAWDPDTGTGLLVGTNRKGGRTSTWSLTP